ncbi:hypothetical protein SK128_023495 [Halocaridina rubra]|uniref:Uncharacterized protein n=1 Tax=Halocaridina rubra TaxID=373956 RepID=A0AAN9A8R8_HALRR
MRKSEVYAKGAKFGCHYLIVPLGLRKHLRRFYDRPSKLVVDDICLRITCPALEQQALQERRYDDQAYWRRLTQDDRSTETYQVDDFSINVVCDEMNAHLLSHTHKRKYE